MIRFDRTTPLACALALLLGACAKKSSDDGPAANLSPVNSVPAAQTTDEEVTLVFSTGNANLVSISDPDAGSQPVQVALTAAGGQVSLSGVAGLTFTVGDGSSDTTMTFSGTIADINAALDGLSFIPTPNGNGPATLQVVTNDLGNTGAGGPSTDSDTISITINAVNDPPLNTVPAPQFTDEDVARVFSPGNGNAISIADDATGLVQVSLTALDGRITLGGTAGLAFTVGDGTLDVTMTFTGLIAAVNTALNGLTFTPDPSFNGGTGFQLVTNDQGGTGTGGPLSDTDNIVVTVDPVSFNLPKGFNNAVTAVAASDAASGDAVGDFYVAGSFTTYDRTACNRIVRLNGDGSVDPTFVISGTSFSGPVEVLVSAGDGTGKIYVGGSFTSYGATAAAGILRLNADGSVDATFVYGSGFNDTVEAIALTNDGSDDILVGGDFTTYKGGAAVRFVRLDDTGTVVVAALGTGFDDAVKAIAPATDGSDDCFVAGNFLDYAGTNSERIIRLNGDMTVNAAPVGTGFNAVVETLLATDDGSDDVVAGGAFVTYDGTAAAYLARLDGALGLDPAFTPSPLFGDVVYVVASAPAWGSDLVIGGQFATRIRRLNADGSTEATFVAGAGFVGSGFASVQAIAPAAAGDLVAGGDFWRYNATGVGNILRLNADASVEATFATGAGASGFVQAVTQATDGSGDVYAGGFFADYNGVTTNRLVRLDVEGAIDPAFATGAGFSAEVRAIAMTVDGTGDVLVGGEFLTFDGAASVRIARLDADGDPDAFFAVPAAGFNATVRAIAPTADASGDFYVAGDFTTYGLAPAPRILRLFDDGSVNGVFAPGTGFTNGIVSALVPATDGSFDLYAGGSFTDYAGTPLGGIVRLDDGGGIDPAFDPGAGFNGAVRSIALADDGSGDLYVGGAFTDFDGALRNRIIRLNADGTEHAAFVVGTGFDDAVEVVVSAGDGTGKVYVGGQFLNYKGAAAVRIVRLNADGSVDGTFDPGTGFNATVSSIARAGTAFGDIIVGVAGNASSYDGATIDRLVRLDPDGAMD